MVDAEALVRPVVEGAGVELVDVAFEGTGGRRTLRVTVDRDGFVFTDLLPTEEAAR